MGNYRSLDPPSHSSLLFSTRATCSLFFFTHAFRKGKQTAHTQENSSGDIALFERSWKKFENFFHKITLLSMIQFGSVEPIRILRKRCYVPLKKRCLCFSHSVKRDYRCLHLYLKMVTSNKAPFKEEQFNWSLIFLALYVTRYHAFMNFPHFEKLASSFLGKKLKKF